MVLQEQLHSENLENDKTRSSSGLYESLSSQHIYAHNSYFTWHAGSFPSDKGGRKHLQVATVNILTEIWSVVAG